MYSREKKYTSIFSLPVLAMISFLGQGWWSFTLAIVGFVFIPIAELFTGQSEENLTEAQEEKALEDSFYDRVLYLMVPIQFIIIFAGLYIIKNPEAFFIGIHINKEPIGISGELNFINGFSWTLFELIGKVLAMGIACGVVGINLGHELGHRVTRHERFMAKALLLSSMYMHFFIEHNRGHHKNVATDEDPASARRGEILYFFWIRSIIFSYISAWKLESERLKRADQPFFSIHNEMILFQFIQLTFVILIYFIFGLKSTVFFLIAATIGFLLLETINYVEHYGLHRKKSETDSYERVLPVHSWNSNHELGRQFLLELTRHSDHHYKASRKYQILRHFDESPQMPFGYPAMILLSIVPPVWFYVMHRRIDDYRKQLPEGAALD